MQKLAVLLCCVVAALGASIDAEFGVPEIQNGGVHWALIVAGSNGYYNYRHQSDVCHAYQIFKKHGIPDERIVVMMYDDIAESPENPMKGIIINHIDGVDVYHGVPKDYTHKDVNPTTFLKVLQGQKPEGGSGKVIASGPNDHVFVNFADHGAPGILAFPVQFLHASQLNAAIANMHSQNRYAKMVFYIEACESGSIFADGLLPDNINVFATTAANPSESSYACYYDEKLKTYLGDVYSVKWMEDSDKENLSTETLQQQFEIVKRETNTSHVQEYGDMSLNVLPVGQFQAGQQSEVEPTEPLPQTKFDAVKSEDVMLSILQHRLAAAKTVQEAIEIGEELQEVKADRQSVRSTIKMIAGLSTKSTYMMQHALVYHQPMKNTECYEPVVDSFNEACFNLSQNDYALRHLFVIVNLCEEGIPRDTILRAIERACS